MIIKKLKLKIGIASILLVSIIIYMIVSRVIILRDIISLYLVILIPTLVVLSIEFLFRKGIPFLEFFKGKIFGHLLSMIFCLGLVAYSISDKPISKKSAINDFDFMIESLENIHPNIYQEISKDSFQVQYEGIKEDLPLTISNVHFYATLCKNNLIL